MIKHTVQRCFFLINNTLCYKNVSFKANLGACDERFTFLKKTIFISKSTVLMSIFLSNLIIFVNWNQNFYGVLAHIFLSLTGCCMWALKYIY